MFRTAARILGAPLPLTWIKSVESEVSKKKVLPPLRHCGGVSSRCGACSSSRHASTIVWAWLWSMASLRASCGAIYMLPPAFPCSCVGGELYRPRTSPPGGGTRDRAGGTPDAWSKRAGAGGLRSAAATRTASSPSILVIPVISTESPSADISTAPTPPLEGWGTRTKTTSTWG